MSDRRPQKKAKVPPKGKPAPQSFTLPPPMPRREPKWFPPLPPKAQAVRKKSWTDDLKALVPRRKRKPPIASSAIKPEPKWFPAPPPPKEPAPPLDVRGLVSSLSAVSGLLVFGALVIGTGVLSAQFLVSPKSIVWVNQYLPEGLQLQVPGWDQPRTMAEITDDLQKAGLKPGEKLLLGAGKQDDIMIPVLEASSVCAQNCDRIVELRVYRPVNHPYRNQKGPHFRMVAQVIAEGLEDWFILGPMLNAEAEKTGGNGDKVGFNVVEQLGNERNEKGIWLTLKGEKVDGDRNIAFGQLLHYNPKKAMLMPMEPWTSPAGEIPTWQDITGDKRPELVVNQTIGLEPAFKVYQLHPDGHPSGYRFKAIDLEKAALDNRSYIDALTLARSGLWSPALAYIENLKKQGGNWNTAAQVQMDFIAHHGKAMKAQADQPSNSTRQQVLISLMDGRWDKAIASVKAEPEDQSDVMDLLQFDNGILGRRLATASNLSPSPALQAWNVAFVFAKEGKDKALKLLGVGGDRKLLGVLVPDLFPKKKIVPLSTNAPLLPKDMPKDLSNPAPAPVPSTMPAPSFDNAPPVESASPLEAPGNELPIAPSPAPTNTPGQPQA
jgi:hypothetical protein